MTSFAIALPRVVRKRIKPPPPSFWLALGWVGWDLVFAAWDFLCPLGGSPALRVICAAIGVGQLGLLAVVHWPQFWAEWKAWRRDA